MNIKKYLSGCLKVLCLSTIFCLSANISFADTARDFMNRNNYLPVKKYRLFGKGRGSVYGLSGGVYQQGAVVHTFGPLQITTSSYGGTIQYKQTVPSHDWRVHKPFDITQTKSFDGKSGSVANGGLTITHFNIVGTETHPKDGYDGEQGGGFPKPTGSRDEYKYVVSGRESVTKIIAVDKPKPLPTPQNNPYNQQADAGNRQAENNSGDTDRNHDLTGSDNPNMPNSSPDGGNDALADNGELKPQQDTYYGDTCIDCGVDLSKYGGQIEDVKWNPRDPTTVNAYQLRAIESGDPDLVMTTLGVSYVVAQALIEARKHGANDTAINNMVSYAQAGGAMPPDDDKNKKNNKNTTSDTANQMNGKSFSEAEKIADRELLSRGWQKSPLKNGDGVRYFDGKGNSVQINKGYANSNNIHGGPYVKYTHGSQVIRIPLKGNPIGN